MCRGFTCLFIYASGLALGLAFLSVYIFVHVSMSMPVLRTSGLHSFNLSLSLPGFMHLACFLQQMLIWDQPDAYQKWGTEFCIDAV